MFVDGQLKLKRTQVRPEDGTVNVDVEIGPSDRFLTLVSTDAGNGDYGDWVVFGDPVLQMAPTEPGELGGGLPVTGKGPAANATRVQQRKETGP